MKEKQILQDCAWMLFSGILTLVVPSFLLPITMGAGLFYGYRVMFARFNK